MMRSSFVDILWNNSSKSLLRNWISRYASTLTEQHNVALKEKVNYVDVKIHDPKFDDLKVAFGNRTTRELLRAYFVFQLCSKNVFVDNQDTLLEWFRKIAGRRIFVKFMKATVYGQFLAGEHKEEILQTASMYKKNNIIPMFAYTAKETHGTKDKDHNTYNDPLWEINFNALMDGINMAAEYNKCNEMSVKMSGKYTFLVPYDVMRNTSDIILHNNILIDRCLSTDSKSSELLKDCLTNEAVNMLQEAPRSNLPIPKVKWGSDNYDSFKNNLAFHLSLLKSTDLQLISKDLGIHQKVNLSSKNEAELYKLWEWIHILAEEASNKNVCIVMDAEQTYLQEAMDVISLDLQRVFNRERPFIHNTYQCYLKKTYDVVKRDLDIADKEGFLFGGKIVRGAYLKEERQLAKSNGYEDPINPTYEATGKMYNDVAKLILTKLKNQDQKKLQVTFATHNADSILEIISLMSSMQITPNASTVAFAQLLGMRDNLAFSLGAAGIPSHKLLHYGPVEQAIAYLSRRLQENSSSIATANQERKIIHKELKNRLFTTFNL